MSPPPGKKRKTAATTPQSRSTPIQSLPDHLLLSIIARVPRLYYPTLSLVCKSFRSFLISPELYEARSLSGHTESCLYLCLECFPDYRWFTLSRKPDQTLTNVDEAKKSSGYVLARVPVSNSPPANFSSLVTVGSDIYNIAGSVYKAPSSSSVSILDCRSHTWREAPSLGVELTSVSASVLDRKIYAVGRYIDEESDSWIQFFEVLDTKTQIWDPQPANCSETKGKFFNCRTAFIDGKFHLIPWLEKEGAAYNSKEARWELVEPLVGVLMFKDSYCQIENVMYSAFHGKIRWFDAEVGRWRNLMGLVGLRNFPHGASLVRLADYRGTIAAFWVKDFLDDCDDDKKMIWCAVIGLERRKSCEIWGEVEWFDHVLTVPTEYDLVKALAVTV